jgi:hypothetical protein
LFGFNLAQEKIETSVKFSKSNFASSSLSFSSGGTKSKCQSNVIKSGIVLILSFLSHLIQ